MGLLLLSGQSVPPPRLQSSKRPFYFGDFIFINQKCIEKVDIEQH